MQLTNQPQSQYHQLGGEKAVDQLVGRLLPIIFIGLLQTDRA
jgi:hypothetical protein